MSDYKHGKHIGSQKGYAAGVAAEKAKNDSEYGPGRLLLDLSFGFAPSMIIEGTKAIRKALS